MLAYGQGPIAVGRLTMEVKKAKSGKPYIIVSQPVKANTEVRRCCWYDNDWLAIKAAIPQVQSLMVAGGEDKITVDVTKNRAVNFTVGEKFVLISIDTAATASAQERKFSTWMTPCDWQCMVCRQSEIDNAFSVKATPACSFSPDSPPGPRPKPRGVRRKLNFSDDVEQMTVDSRADGKTSITFYSWWVISQNDDCILADGDNILSEKECDEALADAREENAHIKHLAYDKRSHTYIVPCDLELIKLMYVWLVKRKIMEAFAEAPCTACDEHQPGQEAHMSGGCLSSWYSCVAKYGPGMYEKVTAEDISGHYIEFLKEVGIEVPGNILTMALCLKDFMTNVPDVVNDHTDHGRLRDGVLEGVFEKAHQKVIDGKKQQI